MPLPPGTRFRVTKRGDGKVRLAFAKGTNKVIEAKSLKTGKVHTAEAFAADEEKEKDDNG